MIILLALLLSGPQSGFFRWHSDTSVQVYFAPGFSTEQQAAALRGMQAWNVGGITFTRVGETIDIQKCKNCLTLQRGTSSSKKELAHLGVWHLVEYEWIEYAWIILDERTRSVEAIESFVTHETGHSLGLLDCDCKSVMGRFTGGLNKPGPLLTSGDRKAAMGNYR